MDKDANKVMMTVREWAEKAGLKLDNYDGFTEIYSKLLGESSGDFYTHIASRSSGAGDLICTRKAFESGLMNCSMEFPQMSQYDKMADVIPEFVESSINLKIASFIGKSRHYDLKGDELRKELEDLLNLMRHKVIAREKSIRANNTAGEVKISELDEKGFSESQMHIIKRYNGTVEGLETELLDEVIQSLEQALQKRNPKLSEIPLDKIDVLREILYSTARQKTSPEIENEFMYIKVPNQKKKTFVQPFNIIDGEGMKPGVAFCLNTEDAVVKGAMPTTQEINDKIKGATDSKSIDEVPSGEEVDKSLQEIDSGVGTEDRMSLKTRITQLAKKLLDQIKGKSEGR